MTRRCTQRGLSLVELMVGLAVALLVVAGAARAFAGHLEHGRRLLLAARVQQDVRAATELIARDVRRAGHWPLPWEQPGQANPYAALAVDDASGELSFAWSQDDAVHAVASSERHGFLARDGSLRARDGDSGAQPVTDPAVVTVTALDIAIDRRVQPLGHLCTPSCAADDPACPALEHRVVNVVLRAHATADPSVVHEARERVALPNPVVMPGACP